MSASAGAPLSQRLRSLPIANDERADTLLSELQELMLGLSLPEEARSCLKATLVDAPYLRDLMMRHATFLKHVLEQDPDQSFRDLLRDVCRADQVHSDEKALMEALRSCKGRMALLLALLDLGKVWPCDAITKALSDFADAAVLAAVRFSLKEEAKRGALSFKNEEAPEEDSGLILLAMGKHGARELNYSSDIDLIAFYEPSRFAQMDPLDLQPIMVRVVKRVVKIMQQRTEDGYVFRVDLRLRPDPGATAVALSTEAALIYYESLGQNWERAAFIKARPIASDQEAADAFLHELSPFIWRKYMDFAMIADVQTMKRLTHQHKGHGEIAMQGHNVKLGRGGIREIEFFVQTQQLIAGGRNPALRDRQTLVVLEKLYQLGWICQKAAEELHQNYCFLRDVEHRIQMRHDEQTHLLPNDEEGFAAVARLAGFDEEGSFQAALQRCFKQVSKHYSGLFEAEENDELVLVFTDSEGHPDTLDALTAMGFTKAKQVNAIICGWFQGHYRALRTKRAGSTLSQFAPKLLKAFSKTSQPDHALFSFDTFLKSLPAGIQLFSLLKANEHLLDLIAQVMGSAPRLSETIARHPHVFDALLEPAFFNVSPTKEQVTQKLETFLAEAVDYQDVLDRARIFTQEHKFLIGTRLLSNTLSCTESQKLYTTLADSVIQALLHYVIEEMAAPHGKVPTSDVAVLAMGKLGGEEMSPTSDLDLILIYTVDDDVTESDGLRPLSIMQYFARVTQRFIAALSAPSGEGIAYPVDMRLRPSGKSGPLATEVAAFQKYQKESAWTWEHLALTRARVIGGSERMRSQIEDIIHEVLIRSRDRQSLKKDVQEMNERVHNAKKSDTLWDIKSAPGGLVDVEFLTQYLQLAHGAQYPEILQQNTAQALSSIDEKSLLDGETIEILRKAQAIFSDVLQLIRLCSDEEVNSDSLSGELAARLCLLTDLPDMPHLEAELRHHQMAVSEIFNRIMRTTTP